MIPSRASNRCYSKKITSTAGNFNEVCLKENFFLVSCASATGWSIYCASSIIFFLYLSFSLSFTHSHTRTSTHATSYTRTQPQTHAHNLTHMHKHATSHTRTQPHTHAHNHAKLMCFSKKVGTEVPLNIMN